MTSTGLTTNNLLLHYNTFNTSSYNGSGTTITDLSGNNRNGTITGSPTWTSNYFTFVDDYITTPNLSSAIPISNEVHSVEVWVYPTDNGVLVQYNGTTTPNASYHFSAIEIVGGNLEVGLWTGGGGLVSTGNIGAVSFNQWHQIVLTYNGSVCRGYLDGVFKGSVNLTFQSPMDDSLLFYMNFGFRTLTSQGDATNFDGRFGIMRVYNSALTDSQVLSNYNSTVSTISNLTTDGLLLQLDANNSTSYPISGTTVYDLTNSYNHTMNGATFTTLNGVKCFDCTTGTKRIVVNGTGPTLPTSGYTYITWARLIPSTAGFRTLLYTNSPKYTPITIPNGGSTLGYWDSEFRSSGYDASAFQGVWAQFAVVGDNVSQTFYINGSQVGNSILQGSGGIAHWGWGNNDLAGQPWGHVANLYLYNKKLSLNEIQQQYNFLSPRFVESISTPTPTETPTPTPTSTATVTPTNSVTPTPSITVSETPTATPTPTITPSSQVCDTFTFNNVNATTTYNSATGGPDGGWTSSAYSTETYSNPVSVTFQTSVNGNYLMGGFSYNPTANNDTYTNTTYGLYTQNNFLEIYENGGQATVPGGMVTLSTDIWKVEYDGTNVKYYKNSSLIHTSSNPVTQPLHIFFALLTPNEGVTNVCVVGTPDPLPTPTPTETPTPTSTVTPTPSITSTITPTPSASPIPITGYGYNLVVLPYQVPISGNTIFPTFASGGVSGTTNPNTFATNGVYWNVIDNLSVDRTSYYSGMTGNSVTVYFTQNGDTAIYSGSSTSFVYNIDGGNNFNYNPNLRPNQLVLIQSASANFVTGQTVYISYTVNVSITPTPTATSTITPSVTPTASITPTMTVTPTATVTPSLTVTPTPTVSSVSTLLTTSNLILHYDPSNASSYPGTGTTITDLSGNGRNGTMSNITYTSPYFTYNGSSSQIAIADNALLEPGSGDWTVEVWVNQSVSGNDVVLGKFNAGGASSNVGYSIRTLGTSFYAQYGSGAGSGATLIQDSTSYSKTINTWHQLVYVFTNVAANTFQTFVNGSSIGSVGHSLASILNTTTGLYIGSYNNGEYAQWFDGKIGITRLYNRALTSTEVLNNYNTDKSKYGL
jgi:hypothetical protein